MAGIGLIFFRCSKKSAAENRATAIQFKGIAVPKFRSEVPQKVSNKMVAAAEAISPSDADFNPFSVSET